MTVPGCCQQVRSPPGWQGPEGSSAVHWHRATTGHMKPWSASPPPSPTAPWTILAPATQRVVIIRLCKKTKTFINDNLSIHFNSIWWSCFTMPSQGDHDKSNPNCSSPYSPLEHSIFLSSSISTPSDFIWGHLLTPCKLQSNIKLKYK